jgi:hypothetical protein
LRIVLLLAALTVGATLLVVRHGSALMDGVMPADRDRIAGISLGESGNVTRIPRRALDCATPEPGRGLEACTTLLDGQPIAIRVEYLSPRQIQFAACEASYGTTTTGCWAIIFAVTGPLVYAQVPVVRPGQPHETRQWLGPGRVQRVQAPHLELREATLQAIRAQYPLDNYLERDWVARFRASALLAALGVGVVAFVLTSLQRPLWQPGLPRLTAPVIGLVAAGGCGGGVFGVSYVALLFGAMRAGLVD